MSMLNIPSFDDFLVEMGQERMLKWADEANASAATLNITIPLDQQSMTQFVTAITALNVKYMTAMLRDYHEWLIGQLGQRSLHLLK